MSETPDVFWYLFFFSAENEKNLLEISGEFKDQRERESWVSVCLVYLHLLIFVSVSVVFEFSEKSNETTVFYTVILTLFPVYKEDGHRGETKNQM